MTHRPSARPGPRGTAAVATVGGSPPSARSRLLGWKREALIFAFAYLAYEFTRTLATGGYPEALQNARRVFDVQALLSSNIEAAVQGAIHATPVMDIFNIVYLAAQPVIIPIVVIWAYRRSKRVYRVLRDTLITTWLIALPVYALFPTAPPRLSGIGVVDTVSAQSGVALDSGFTKLFYNPYAAVPSLHAAFAVAVGVAGAVIARHWWLKVTLGAWGPLVIIATVATGNHFWLDAAAGIAILVLGLLISAVVVRGGRIWGDRGTAPATALRRAGP
jgi:membrane-associated phospholipid phosphatase